MRKLLVIIGIGVVVAGVLLAESTPSEDLSAPIPSAISVEVDSVKSDLDVALKRIEQLELRKIPVIQLPPPAAQPAPVPPPTQEPVISKQQAEELIKKCDRLSTDLTALNVRVDALASESKQRKQQELQAAQEIAKAKSEAEAKAEQERKLAAMSKADRAMLQAKEQGVKLVMEFSAVTCGPCRFFEEQVLSTKTFQDRVNGKYLVCNLDVEDEGNRDRFKIYKTPNVIVYDPKTASFSEPFIPIPRTEAFLSQLERVR